MIQRHFWLKRDEICEQIEAWIHEMEQGTSAVSAETTPENNRRVVQRSYQSHVSALKRHYAALKEELAKMIEPLGLPACEKNCTET